LVIKAIITLPEDGTLVLKHVRHKPLVYIYENIMYFVGETKSVLI